MFALLWRAPVCVRSVELGARRGQETAGNFAYLGSMVRCEPPRRLPRVFFFPDSFSHFSLFPYSPPHKHTRDPAPGLRLRLRRTHAHVYEDIRPAHQTEGRNNNGVPRPWQALFFRALWPTRLESPPSVPLSKSQAYPPRFACPPVPAFQGSV